MLCQKCGLKEAVVHVVCVVNDKQIDKWLCSDCVEELAPSNFLSGTVFNAKEFLDGLLKPKAREEQIMNRFTERAKVFWKTRCVLHWIRVMIMLEQNISCWRC